MKNIIFTKRKKMSLTLLDIASYVGVDKATVQRWENGKVDRIKKGDIKLLCEILKITPEELLEDIINSDPEEPEQRKEVKEMADNGNKQELLWALKVIRSECKKHNDCLECPLCDINYGCNMKNESSPKNWVLISEPKEIWRAFESI